MLAAIGASFATPALASPDCDKTNVVLGPNFPGPTQTVSGSYGQGDVLRFVLANATNSFATVSGPPGLTTIYNLNTGNDADDYTVPTSGLYFIQLDVRTGTLGLTCTSAGAAPTPPTPLTPATADDFQSFVNGSAFDRFATTGPRLDQIFDNIADSLDPNGCQGYASPDSREEYLARKDNYNRDSEQYDRSGGLPVSDLAAHLRCEYAALRSSAYAISFDAISPPPERIAQSVANPGVAVQFGSPGSAFGLSGPELKGLLNFNAVSRSAGGISRQSTFSDITLLGIFPLADKTALGVDLNAGTGSSSQAGNELDVNWAAIEAFLTRSGSWAEGFKAPDIGELFGSPSSTSSRPSEPPGFDIGAILGAGVINYNSTEANGATAQFGGNYLEAGLLGKAHFVLGGFNIDPRFSALVQFQHLNGFTNSAGTVFAPTDMTSFDLGLGKTISKDFYDPEHEVTITPSITGLLNFNAYSITPAQTPAFLPPDAFTVKLSADVKARWDSGLTLEAGVGGTFGQSTQSFNAHIGIKAPIDLFASGTVEPKSSSSLTLPGSIVRIN